MPDMLPYAEALRRTYSYLSAYLGTRERRPAFMGTKYQTAIVRQDYDRAVSVVLFATSVVMFYEDGRVRVSTGGWPTQTTINRIRTWLPDGFTVFSYARWRQLAREPWLFRRNPDATSMLAWVPWLPIGEGVTFDPVADRLGMPGSELEPAGAGAPGGRE